MRWTKNSSSSASPNWLNLIRSALAAAVTVSALWLTEQVASRGWPDAGPSGPTRVDDVVTGALAWCAVGLTAWLALVATLSLLAAAPGAVGAVFGHLARLTTPHFARRALSLALGASVGAVALPAPTVIAQSTVDRGSLLMGAPGPGVAVPSPGFEPSMARRLPPAPGWLPDRPATSSSRSEDARLLNPAPRPSSSAMDTVTVRRGDTLWSIAARHLGAGADETAVALEWPRWFRANRAMIGDDPNLIKPGQQLVPPEAETGR